MISKTGADADISSQGPKTSLFSEDYQADVYRRQIETLQTLDYIKGISPWILYDFRVERRQIIFQRGHNRKGLIAGDKVTRKAAFNVLANHYASRAVSEDSHHAILIALQCKDPVAARQNMWQYLENVREILMKLSDVGAPNFDGYLFQRVNTAGQYYEFEFPYD